MTNLLESDLDEGTEVEIRNVMTEKITQGVVTEGGIVRQQNEEEEHRAAYSATVYEVVGKDD